MSFHLMCHHTRRRLAAMLLAAALPSATLPGALTAQPSGGQAVVEQMRAAWHERFYRTMTFVQETSFPGRPTQTWYESMRVPGALRIDVAPIDSGNAMLFLRDSSHIFRRRTRVTSRAGANEMLIVFADIYVQPVAETLRALRAAGVDVSRSHRTVWRGDSVAVVGASVGDSTSAQFWVRTKDWRTVRIRLASGAAADGLDAQVERIDLVDGIPVETQIAMYRKGVLVQRESYSDVRLNVPLDSAIFDPTQFIRPTWIPPRR